ncbi:MAG: hypothetical protein ACTJHC_09945 [Vagococcus sp.]
MTTSTKKIIKISFILIGLLCITFGLSKENESTTMLVAIGSGLIGGSLSTLIKHYRFTKQPDTLKSYKIEINDPRNKEIRTIALAKAGHLLEIVVILLSFIAIFTSQPIWMVLLLVASFLSYQALIYYYSKLQH